MFRTVNLAMLMTVVFLTCGCFGGNETDAVTYVVSIGIDATEGKEIEATYRIGNPRSLGGKDGSGSEKPTELVSIRTVNLAEARNLLNSVASRNINLSHVKGFVVSEAYARKGLNDLMSVAMRFQEFRGTMYILVVKDGTVKELLEKNSPKLEILHSKYLENMFSTANKSGYLLSTQIHEFYRRMKSNKGSPYAALIGINPQNNDGRAEGAQVKGEKSKDYTAGNIPREDQFNPVEMLGTAIFAGDKMVGTLTGQETRMVSILQGQFGQGYLVVADPMVPEKNVNVRLRLARSPKITCRFEGDKAKIKADVVLEGEITSLPSGVNYESGQYSHLIEQQISQVIEQEMSRTLRKTQELGSDVVGFGAYTTHLYTTYDEMAKTNFEQLYPNAEITLTVKTTIRRTGLTWRTTPLPKKE